MYMIWGDYVHGYPPDKYTVVLYPSGEFMRNINYPRAQPTTEFIYNFSDVNWDDELNSLTCHLGTLISIDDLSYANRAKLVPFIDDHKQLFGHFTEIHKSFKYTDLLIHELQLGDSHVYDMGR